MDLTPLLMLSGFLMMLRSAVGLDQDLSCAVCRALVDEVNFEIGKVDPKKKIQVGSFRVDPKGNQKTYEKSYARSEVHLLEIFEGVCEKFRKYAESTNSAGKRSIARIEARQDGKALALKNVKVSPDTQKLIKYGCETLVEEYEEEMITLFGKDNIEDMETAVCGDLTSQCTGEDLSIPMPQTEIDENVIIPGDNDDDDKKADTTDEKADTSDKGRSDTPVEDKEEREKQSSEGVDQELLDEYLKDNLAQDTDSIPADQVIDQTFGSTQKKKEEL